MAIFGISQKSNRQNKTEFALQNNIYNANLNFKYSCI